MAKPVAVLMDDAEVAQALRSRMEEGALNLRGIAAALRVLETRFEGLEEGSDNDAAVILRLLARDVDLEADAMGEAEAALLHVVTGEQLKAHMKGAA